jgi:cell division protein FtsQ
MPTLTDRGRTTPPADPGSITPPMDPRIEARLVAVQRAAARRRRWWAIAIGGVAAITAGAVGISQSPLLAVHHLKLTGESHTTTAQVLAATGLDHHPLMTELALGRLRANLEALPWVATASVQRHWPQTVSVRLTERVPVAAVANAAGGPALVDRSGRVLAESAEEPSSVPTVTGLGPAGAPGSFLAPAPGVTDALVLATALPAVEAASPSQIKEIVVADGTLDLTLMGGTTVTFGTAEQLDAKLLALHTLLQQVSIKGIAGIDLRLPSAPVLTHAAQGSTVSTIPRG